MGRISLAQKLKKSNDFELVLKKVNSSPDKVKYVQENFNVSYITAKKFVEEIGIEKEVLKAGTDEDKSVLIAKSVLVRLQSNIDYNVSTRVLSEFLDEIKNLNLKVLLEVFKLLSNKTSTTTQKYKLINAIKYMAQTKYYELIFNKEIPAKVQELTNVFIKDCL